MNTKPLEIWQIDINKKYIITDDLLVFDDIQAFDDYYFNDALYDGTIKDNYEQWCETNAEEKGATEISGSEAIAILHKEAVETAEYWKKRYYETMKEGENK